MCIKDVYERNLTNADNIGLVRLKKRRQNSTRIEKNGAGYVFLNIFGMNVDVCVLMKF